MGNDEKDQLNITAVDKQCHCLTNRQVKLADIFGLLIGFKEALSEVSSNLPTFEELFENDPIEIIEVRLQDIEANLPEVRAKLPKLEVALSRFETALSEFKTEYSTITEE